MTIKRKRLSPSGALEEVETSSADIVDIEGTADSFSGANSAKTCKFSDGTLMKANPGKRIGIQNISMFVSNPLERTITVQETVGSNSNPTGPITGIRNDIRAGSTSYPEISSVTYKFETAGTIPFRRLNISAELVTGNTSGQIFYQISNDNVTFTTIYTNSFRNQSYNPDYTSPVAGEQFIYVKISLNISSFRRSGSIRLHSISELGITGDGATVKLINSASQDSTVGADLIPNQVVGSGGTFLFANDIVISDPATPYINLVLVSYSGTTLHLSASEITSIKEVV